MMSILFAGCNKGNEVEPDRGVAQKNIGKWIVPNAIWMLPSIKQWGTMGARAGGSSTYITLRDGFRTIGGQNLKKVPYWSSTPNGSKGAGSFGFSNGTLNFYNRDVKLWVRACLAF